MNNLQFTHQLFKKTGLASLILLSQINTVYALDVTINGSEPLPLSTDISYDFQNNPSTLDFQVNTPIVCTSIRNTTEPLVLVMSDANDIDVTSLNSGLLTTSYDLAENLVRFITDDSIKCATENGLLRETISRLGFESGQDDLQITLLDVNGQPFDDMAQVSDEQNFIYQYVINNNGTTTISADIGEYYDLNDRTPFFDGVAGNDWSCSEANLINGGSTTTCGTNLFGEGTVELSNAIIEPGEQLIVTASRIVTIPGDTVGTPIEVLTAGFVRNADDTIVENNVVFKSFGTTDNNAPTISAIADVTFLEGGASDVLSFTVSDIESDDASLVVSASSSDVSVIPNANIVLAGTGSNRTVQFTPNVDANTAAGPVTITLTVSDGISTTDGQFDVVITPVNDAPSFTLPTIADWPAGTSGLQSVKGFVENLSLGASPDEASQSILESSITVQSDPNGVFAFAPTLSLGGNLSYALSGVGGTVVVDVVLQDNGGLANGGMDTSNVVSFTVTVLNTLPVISTINDLSFDEDTNSGAVDFTVSDAETDVTDLVVNAMSSDTSIIPVSGIQFTGTGATRTLVVTPAADQNTSISGPVTITVILDDGSDTSEATFEVDIDPINDAPTFDLSADIVWPAASSGLKQHAGYANNIHMGPTDDEDNTQLVTAFNVVVTGDAIFGSLGEPVMDNNGGLAYVLNGVSGVATIEVSMQDDAGVANGGVDTSTTQTFTITVE